MLPFFGIKNMMFRNTIYEEVSTVILEDCSVQSLVEKLQALQLNYPNDELKLTPDGGGYDGYDSLCVYYERLESDEEYDKRLEEWSEKEKKKKEAEMKKLLNKKNLSTEEKEKLIHYVRNYK